MNVVVSLSTGGGRSDAEVDARCHTAYYDCNASIVTPPLDFDMDDNPRPQKRLRADHPPDLAESSEPHCLAHVPLSSTPTTSSPLRPLPPQVLLLALPALLAHPPTHEKYGLSLFLSLNALRQCLQLKTLAPDIECHAWTAFAEVGLRVIESGFSTSGEHDWANKLEEEVSAFVVLLWPTSTNLVNKVDKAIGKGVSSVTVPSLYVVMLMYQF